MPKEMEEALKREVSEKHPDWSQKHKDAWVYGSLRKTGWKPSTQKHHYKRASTLKGK